MPALLAFDTSGERAAVAVSRSGHIASAQVDGGAKASSTLLPTILRLLADAGLRVDDLDAIAFGRGPGAFTGIRTACSVAQGLALGAGKPVLPIDSLLAIAEEGRRATGADRVWAVVDARMNEIYAAEYAWVDGRWRTLVGPMLCAPPELNARWLDAPPAAVAGDALVAFAGRLDTGDAACAPAARPSGVALIALAQAAWQDGAAVDAALALPLYVRDRVALTTVEREAARVERDATRAGAVDRTAVR